MSSKLTSRRSAVSSRLIPWLLERCASGVVSPDDARRALAELRRRHREIAPHVLSIKIVYEGAVKTIEDPAAKVAELRYVRPHSNLA